MIGEPSILSEAIRGEIADDCEAVGYSPGDAARLADRIVDGWLLPGLAVALEGRVDTPACEPSAARCFEAMPLTDKSARRRAGGNHLAKAGAAWSEFHGGICTVIPEWV
ncbi:MAG: hypothetical protein ABSD28_06420 [Tepidisphaeraceae bacterium]|jgi:hypothetical protein